MHFSTLAAVALAAVTMALNVPQGSLQIVGGVTASQGDVPFIISMQKDGRHICGGSLLNANTVLTAAHCAIRQTASSISIRAGSLSRGSGGVVARVSSIKLHPDYSESTLDSDMAILKLSTPISVNSTIEYATLAAAGSEPDADSSLIVAGWGTTSPGGSSPTTLRKVDVPVVDRDTCRSQYSVSEITDNMFCAGVTEGGKDSCQGDSGGPIIDENKTLVGVVSWGAGCAQPNKPGVYAGVGTLSSFITSNL